MNNLMWVCCWVCGKQSEKTWDLKPTFGFEVAARAHEIGWIGISDTYRGRWLVLCSESCLKAATTKRGHLRARPPKGRRTEATK